MNSSKAKAKEFGEKKFDIHPSFRGTLLEGGLKISQPPAQDARPFNRGDSPVQRGEEVGVVHRTLNTVPLRKLKRKTMKSFSHEIHGWYEAAATLTVEFVK